MGFSLGKLAGTIAGGGLGGIGGALVGNKVGGAIDQGPNREEQRQNALNDLESQKGTARENMVDPGILAARDAQIAQANQFRSGIGNMRSDLQGQGANNARVNLAQSIAANKSNANSRGLLYSGLRQAGEAGAQGSAANSLAQSNAGINSNLEQQAGSLEQAGIQSGVQAGQSENALADALAGRQAAAQEATRQNTDAFGKTIGGIAGSSAGLLKK